MIYTLYRYFSQLSQTFSLGWEENIYTWWGGGWVVGFKPVQSPFYVVVSFYLRLHLQCTGTVLIRHKVVSFSRFKSVYSRTKFSIDRRKVLQKISRSDVNFRLTTWHFCYWSKVVLVQNKYIKATKAPLIPIQWSPLFLILHLEFVLIGKCNRRIYFYYHNQNSR